MCRQDSSKTSLIFQRNSTYSNLSEKSYLQQSFREQSTDKLNKPYNNPLNTLQSTLNYSAHNLFYNWKSLINNYDLLIWKLHYNPTRTNASLHTNTAKIIARVTPVISWL